MNLKGILAAAIITVFAIQHGAHAAETHETSNQIIKRSPPRQDPAHPVTEPNYPADAVSTGLEGEIILGFYVNPDGTVDPRSIRATTSSGVPAIDESAIKAASQWHFLPATENGQPIGSDHQFRIIFHLKGGKLDPGPQEVWAPLN